jgi:hypothetical protein
MNEILSSGRDTFSSVALLLGSLDRLSDSGLAFPSDRSKILQEKRH